MRPQSPHTRNHSERENNETNKQNAFCTHEDHSARAERDRNGDHIAESGRSLTKYQTPKYPGQTPRHVEHP